MSYDPDAEPWRTARALVDEFGDKAPDELWMRAQQMVHSGKPVDAVGLAAIMRAVMALRPSRNPIATVH